GLDVVQALAKLPPSDAGRLYNAVRGRGDLPPWMFRFIPVPYEQTAREMNRAYDGMVAAARQPTYADRADALRLWAAEILPRSAPHPYLAFLSSAWPLPLPLPHRN